MTPWGCRSWRTSLVDDAAGTLDADGRVALAAHLRGCDSCRTMAADLRALPAQLARGADTAPDDAFFTRQRDAIMRSVRHSAPEPATARGWRWAWSPVLVGATALLALALWRPVPLAVPTHIDGLDGDELLALSDVTRGLSSDTGLVGETAFDENHPGDLLHELPDEDLAALDDLIGDGSGGTI